MNILKKLCCFYTGAAVLLASIVLEGKTIDHEIQVHFEAVEYTFQYNPDEGYIDYNGTKYNLLTDKNNRIIDITAGDIDSDGRDNLLILEGNKKSIYGNDLVIYDLSMDEGELQMTERYRNHIAVIRPWKIKTCELDKDDELEIFIAVNKRTHYYTKIENRPFFFNFKNNKLVKKWTGSRVRAPFKDVCFGDLDGNDRDEFIVIEEANDGKFVVAVYYWFGFGFVLQGESKVYNEIDSIEVEKKGKDVLLKAKVKEDNIVKFIILEPSTDKSENGVCLLNERGE